MNELGIRAESTTIADIGIKNAADVYWNIDPEELVAQSVSKGIGVVTDSGALAIETGEFTGRSPKDRFIVIDDQTRDTVWWGDINKKFDADKFDALYDKVVAYFEGKDVYVRDAYVCADSSCRMNLRVVTELPWQNMFVYNMFLRPTSEEIQKFTHDWTILAASGFRADSAIDGTRQHNFAIINFARKTILIGGTGYTGEIKKGVFSALNFLLPTEYNVLPMHCSANMGVNGDTSVFFGLSGTGKTTLSADPKRSLIGDDEHGWTDNAVFNFEGGCYAKCIDLTEEKEPQIFKAIKGGALLENIGYYNGTKKVDYSNVEKTENTRVSYPIYHIDNSLEPSIGNVPNNLFFLTCDAFGVLPPISKLDPGQSMYHFISGYTAKVAGTEEGVTEPQTTFSACFGAPFLPLHPTAYAEMLGEKIKRSNAKVWLVNTGWSGGPYGTGSRISLEFTRAMITAALNGSLGHAQYTKDEVFRLSKPTQCEGVPSEVLDPRNTWADKAGYDLKAQELAESFIKNFEKFKNNASQEILSAAPRLIKSVV
jgi:phosphoenolpyruvate carboxykinase (ATP)